MKLPVSTSNSRSKSYCANFFGSRFDSGRKESSELLELSLPLVCFSLVDTGLWLVVVSGDVNIGFLVSCAGLSFLVNDIDLGERKFTTLYQVLTDEDADAAVLLSSVVSSSSMLSI